MVSLIQSDVNGSDDDQSNGLAILFCNSGVPILSSLLFKSSSTSTTDWVLVGGSTKYIDPIKSNGREDDRSNGLAILFCNNRVSILSSLSLGYWWVVVANILIVVKVTVGTTINPTDWQSFSAITGCRYRRLRRCRIRRRRLSDATWYGTTS